MSDSSIINVKVNIEALKELYPEIAFRYYFLKQRNEETTLVPETIRLNGISKNDLPDILDDLKRILFSRLKLIQWEDIMHNMLYLTDTIYVNEIANYDFKQQRRKQLKAVLSNIVAIRELKNTKRKIKSIIIGSTLQIKGELTAQKAIKAIEEELIVIYNNHQIDVHFPKLEEPLTDLKKFLSFKTLKSSTSKDKAIGQICWALKCYLDANSILLAQDTLNFKTKKINLGISNDQANLIADFLCLIRIIEAPKIEPHLRIRRYIFTYNKYLETQLQNGK